MRTAFAPLVVLLLLGPSGCGEKAPLPKGPPPVYEPAREFPGGVVGDEQPGAIPPPVSVPVAPPSPSAVPPADSAVPPAARP